MSQRKDYGKNTQCPNCKEMFNYLGLPSHRARCRELGKEGRLFKSDLTDAHCIGEDGGMCVNGKLTKRGAYRKMIALIREDCSEEDVDTFKENCKPEDLSIAWFHIATEKDKEHFEDYVEWYVSNEERSDYPVWIYYA